MSLLNNQSPLLFFFLLPMFATGLFPSPMVRFQRWRTIRKHCTLRKWMNFSTWTSLVWWRWRPDCSRNKFSEHAGYQTETGWNLQGEPCDTKIWTNAQFRDFYAETPKLTTLRALLTIAAIHGNPVAFTSHRRQVTQNPCVWSQHRKHSWTLPKYGFATKLPKDSGFLFKPVVFSAHKKSTTWVATGWFPNLRRMWRNTWRTWWARDQTNISWVIREHMKTSMHLTDDTFF